MIKSHSQILIVQYSYLNSDTLIGYCEYQPPSLFSTKITFGFSEHTFSAISISLDHIKAGNLKRKRIDLSEDWRTRGKQ